MSGFTAEQLFSAYQVHLERSGLKPLSINCRVIDRTESREWGGTSNGDGVRSTVSVAPTTRQVNFTLDIVETSAYDSRGERSLEDNSVGLRNCLTVSLPASAFSPRFSNPRTADELCGVVLEAVNGSTVKSVAETSAQTCTLALPRGTSTEVTIYADDLRTASLVQLLDSAPPQTEPTDAFFQTTTATSCSITMMTLPEGPLRLSANDPTVCEKFAEALAPKH